MSRSARRKTGEHAADAPKGNAGSCERASSHSNVLIVMGCRAALLKIEEDWIEHMCRHVAEFKPDVVITEKGLSDLATHFLTKAGISAIRRLRKTDNNRIARACGATVVHRPEEIRESDIGTGAGLFEVKKIGDEFFSFIVDCKVGSRLLIPVAGIACA